MNELPLPWKLFKAVCIVQLVFTGLQIVLAIVGLFYNAFWHNILAVFIYALMFIYINQGLALLNYHYPYTPLSVKQKRNFNILFLLNFLFIAFLFAEVVREWRYSAIIRSYDLPFSQLILYLYPLIIAGLTFLLHLSFLGGMYSLRRTIYENNEQTWDNFLNEDDQKQ